MRIYIIGMPGSGKTFFGRKLARALGMAFADTDELVEQHYGKAIKEIIAEEGESQFRKKERECLRLTADMNATVIACGGGTPAFYDNMDWIRRHGKSIWLQTHPSLLCERILKNQSRRPAFATLSPAEVQLKLQDMLLKRQNWYRLADITITDNQQIGKMLNSVIQNLMKADKKIR